MASGTVAAAIEDFLQAHWTTTPLLFENQNAAMDGSALPPQTPGPFVALNFSGRNYGQVSIGASVQADNRWDETGVVMLDVLVPAGTGSRAARTYAKQLADLFRGLTLLGDTLEFLDASLGSGAASDRFNGNYYVIPVDIEFRRIEA
jgi:hypothetical protein